MVGTWKVYIHRDVHDMMMFIIMISALYLRNTVFMAGNPREGRYHLFYDNHYMYLLSVLCRIIPFMFESAGTTADDAACVGIH
jgi:hypothetical protein